MYKTQHLNQKRQNRPGRAICILLLLFFIFGLAACSETENESQVGLSAEEREWLDENGEKLVLYYNIEFPPIEFSSADGTFTGMGADVIVRIEEMLDISFIKIPSDDWNEHLAALRSGECAVAPTIVRTAEREAYVFFSTPYATAPVVIITPHTISGRLTLEDLTGWKVGVVSGYATEKYMRDQALLSQFEVVSLANVPEGLKSVSFGEIDAFVENIAVAAYYIDAKAIPNLRVAGQTDYAFAWSIGISREYPLLYSSIQKALDGISESELADIRKKWITLEGDGGLDPENLLLLRMGGLFAVLLLAGLAGITLILKNRLNQKVVDLQESENRYKRLAENSPAVVYQFMISAVGDFSFPYISEALRPVTGIFPREAMHDPNIIIDKIHPDDKEMFLNSVEQSAKTLKDFYFVFRFLKNGQITWLEARSTPERMPDGSILWDGFLQDITERKLAEEELRESSERLLKVMNSIDAFIYIADMQTYELLFINEYGRKTWGDNVIGEQCWKALQGAEGPCPFCTNDKLLTEDGEPAGVYQWEFQNRINGRWYDLRDCAIQWTDGRLVRMEIATDITERKRAEEVIAAKNKELEQLIYVASHDLRSPLVNVDGYGRELEYAVGELSSTLTASPASPEDLEAALRSALPEMKEALQHIRSSTKQMDALLKGLLKLSRTGRASLTIAPLDMNELLARVSSALEYQVREAGAVLQVSELPPCEGDAVQLTQVFTNLISNSLKYMEPERPGSITISGTTEKGRSVYCVADNGIGIAPEHQQIIFELFYRLEPGEKEGDGLGLTIVKQILYRLGGEIWVESEPGAGSRFYISLPVANWKIEN